MFPEPVTGRWNWQHDGVNTTGMLTFHEDHTVTSRWLRFHGFFKHGTWEYNRNNGILTWHTTVPNQEIHRLYFNKAKNMAVLYRPVRTPASTMWRPGEDVNQFI